MKKLSIDTVLHVRLKHRPGQLARFAEAIAEQGALLGDITTLKLGEEDSVREVTIETADEAHTNHVLAAISKVEGAEILSVTDRVFECHQGGKLHSTSRVKLKRLRDLRYIYTPGVARVAKAIEKHPEMARDLTTIGNSVGIFTNGTRVLGLGNVGPLASMPVMEGKAVLYDRFAQISATPILIDTLDVPKFIETVMLLSLTFGGIHLEDIRIPDCYQIEDELKAKLDKPVMHDDQHGTATVALSAVMNACQLTGIDLKNATVGQIGLGAAGGAIASLMMAYGVGHVMVFDPNPLAIERIQALGAQSVTMETIMSKADIVIAATGKPGLISPSLVRKGQVLFPLSNPDPEIDPRDALAAGAVFAADGRSINNALAFPGLFRGALSSKSRSITQGMMLAASKTIAAHAEKGEVVPSPLNTGVHHAVAEAVAAAARAEGLEGTAKTTRRQD